MECKSENCQKKITKHVFNHHIEKVWLVMCDLTKCHYLVKEEAGEINFIKGDNTYQVGNQFEFFLNSNLVFTCLEVVNYKYYKKISWSIDIKNKSILTTEIPNINNINVLISLTLHEISSNNSTLFYWISLFNFLNKLTADESKKITKDIKRIRNYMIKIKDYYLKNVFEKLTQLESINIYCDILDLWNLITDLKLLKSISMSFCEEVEYFGDPLKVGTKIKLGFNISESEKMICYLSVEEVNNTDCDDLYVYQLRCDESYRKAPVQIIQFTIMRIKALKFCHLMLKHEFMQTIVNSDMEKFKEKKANLLNDIKIYIEAKNKELRQSD
jgi:hypothetical protein